MLAPLTKFMFHLPIRTLLMLLVLISLLPALAMMTYSGVKIYDYTVDDARDHSLRVMQTISHHQHLLEESTRQLLATLARLSEIQRLDVPACNALFRELMAQNPIYANVFLVDARGMVIASAIPTRPHSVKGRKYFQDVLKTHDLSTGEHVIGVSAQRPVFHFAYPVLDRGGSLKAVVVAALDLGKYDVILAGTNLPDRSALAFSDRRGVILYRYPGNYEHAGKPDLPLMRAHMSGEEDEGVFTETGVDRVRRFYAYKRFELKNGDSPYLYMRLGIPEDRALDAVREEITRNLLLVGFILLAALASAWLLGSMLVRNPLNRLVLTTNRFRDGQGDVRTCLPHTGSELGQLAAAFDELYADLESRNLERRQAEAQIREAHRWLSEIIEFLPDATLILDRDGKAISWNRAIEAMTGIQAQVMLGKGNYEYALPFYGERRPILIDLALHPDPEMEKHYTTIRRTGDVVFGESFVPNLPSGVAHLSATASVLHDANGDVVAAIECIRDNTERRQAEEALRESEERLRALFESIDDFVFIKDLKRRYILINDFYTKRFGIDRSEFVGKTDAELSLCENKAVTLKTVHDTDSRVLGGESAEYELTHVIHGSAITFSILKTPIRDDRGTVIGICGVSRDITERKRTEEERRQLEQRLSRSEKMESLGMLAGGVAHDLNNVLGILVGYSELLVDELDAASPLRPHAEYIRKGGERAAAIVQDLLTMARRGVQTREVVDLNTIIDDFQETPEFEKVASFHPDVQIETVCSAGLLNIKGSPIHLRKTVMNLVSNAAEAMPEGGLITITTGNEYLDRPVAGYDDVQEGDYVVLSVTDTGEGISPADIKRVFEPFYTKKVLGRSGTGLGLAVVWGTVKDHCGYVHVQSEPGKGTTFTLSFPATREKTPREQALPKADYLGRGESLLVVDDVPGQRELAARMLTKLNYHVEMVESGEAAVEYLRTDKVDLLVLDMIMDPGIDGLETYKRIKQIHPLQKAVIVSGFSDSGRVQQAQALGAGPYVRKPYLMETLGAAVRKELDR
jgi:PAS domain S-box-containing protein